MPQRTVDTVIFDLGGVIMSNGKPSDFASRFPEADRERVIEIIMGPYGQDSDHPWHRVERGEITMEECRSLNRDAIIESGIMPILSTMQPQAQESSSTGGISFNFSLSEPMVRLIHELRDNDIRIGVLTNNVREFREWWWPLMDFETVFDTVVDSSEVGLRKPNPAIYHLTMDRLGATPSRTAFLDDLQPNVDAASALGMHGIRVDDDPSAAIAQTRLLVQL